MPCTGQGYVVCPNYPIVSEKNILIHKKWLHLVHISRWYISVMYLQEMHCNPLYDIHIVREGTLYSNKGKLLP